MFLIPKLSIASGSAATLSVGGTYFLKYVSNVMPAWHSLAADNNYESKRAETGGYGNKFGEEYAQYLVGLDVSNGDIKPDENDDWWDWIFEQVYKGNYEARWKFKDVISGSEDEGKSLKSVCAEAYKNSKTDKIKSQLPEEEDDESDDDFYEPNIWQFCSPLGMRPSTVAVNGEDTWEEYAGKIASVDGKKEKLVSVKDSWNNAFWKLKHKYFFEGKEPDGTNEKFFQALHKDEKAKTNSLSLKAKCAEAYIAEESANSSEEAPKTEEVVKFCTLEGK